MAAKRSRKLAKKRTSSKKRASKLQRELQAAIDSPLGQLARAVMPRLGQRVALAVTQVDQIAGAAQKSAEEAAILGAARLEQELAPVDAKLADAIDRLLSRTQ